jgi:hypothetical protein
VNTSRFLIHLTVAESLAVAIASFTKDRFSLTFYTTCVCLLIWDFFLGIVYLIIPKSRRDSLFSRCLLSVSAAWLVPAGLTIALIFINPHSLETFLHFNR